MAKASSVGEAVLVSGNAAVAFEVGVVPGGNAGSVAVEKARMASAAEYARPSVWATDAVNDGVFTTMDVLTASTSPLA